MRTLAALLVLLSPAAAAAAGRLAAVEARGAVRVCLVTGLVPFAAAEKEAAWLRGRTGSRPVDAGGVEVAGLDVELALALGQALGARVEWSLAADVPALLDAVAAGRCDLGLGGVTRTLARARRVAFSAPYFASGPVVLVPAGAPPAGLEALDRKEVRIVLRAGTTAAQFVAAELPAARAAPVGTDGELLAALADPAVPAVVVDYLWWRDARVRGRAPEGRVLLEDRRFGTEHFALVVAQGDADWLAWLDLFLDETRRTGRLHRLAARYNEWLRLER